MTTKFDYTTNVKIFNAALARREELGHNTKLNTKLIYAYAEALEAENLSKIDFLTRMTEIIETHEF